MDGGWVRLVIDVGADERELAEDVLWQQGAAGIEEQEDDDGVRLLAGFPDEAAGLRARAAIAERGFGTGDLVPVEDDGLDAWREWAQPVRAGRFWITPAWSDPPVTAAGEEILWLDPGHTFGSGSHPTTRLVLAAIDGLVQPGYRVLDVGCGSGVLAIGAAWRGAAHVEAIDIDPASPAATEENAARNGVAVSVSNRPLQLVAAHDPPFDLVVANLLAPVVAELAPDLVACTAPGGSLIVSGLLADRWESSMEALAPLRVVSVEHEDGWVAVTLADPDSARR